MGHKRTITQEFLIDEDDDVINEELLAIPRKRRLTEYLNDLHIGSNNVDNNLIVSDRNIRVPRKHVDVEYIDSIDDYLSSDLELSDTFEVGIKLNNSNDDDDDDDDDDNNKEKPKYYYISKKFLDPLKVYDNNENPINFQYKRNQAVEKILSEKLRLNDDILEADTEDNLMDIDDNDDLNGNFRKKSKKEDNSIHITDGEIYKQMYMDKSFALIKYQTPKLVIYENWVNWVKRQSIPTVEEYDSNIDDDMMDLDDF